MISVVANAIIGTHVQGFGPGKPQFNSASPIGGQYGNPYNALAGAIEQEFKPISKEVLMKELPSPGSTTQVHSSTPRTPKKERDYAALKKYHTLFLVDDSDSMMEDSALSTKWDIVKSVVG